jgi:hypothetical protein
MTSSIEDYYLNYYFNTFAITIAFLILVHNRFLSHWRERYTSVALLTDIVTTGLLIENLLAVIFQILDGWNNFLIRIVLLNIFGVISYSMIPNGIKMYFC